MHSSENNNLGSCEPQQYLFGIYQDTDEPHADVIDHFEFRYGLVEGSPFDIQYCCTNTVDYIFACFI